MAARGAEGLRLLYTVSSARLSALGNGHHIVVTLASLLWRSRYCTLKIMENEKHPLDDLKNDEITKKREK